MELVIPDGARVTIAIGPEPAALPETVAIGHPPAGPHHLLLKGAAVGVLVLGAFIAGQRFGGGGGAQFAFAAARQPPGTVLPLPTQHAFANAPLPRPAPPLGSSSAAQVPPQFARQMDQPPVVVPPPGQAPTAAPGKNPFGLEN
jgi:hypothetical protein